jgi:hypothetical protein
MKRQFLPHGKHCVCVKKTNWLMLFRRNKHFFFVKITLNLHTQYVGEMDRFGTYSTCSNECGKWSDLLSGEREPIVH